LHVRSCTSFDLASLSLFPLQHLQKQLAAGADPLLALPEHCVKETTGERVMVAAGLLSIMLQLATAYVGLSLSLRLPAKSE
jgi:hypothetical protein